MPCGWEGNSRSDVELAMRDGTGPQGHAVPAMKPEATAIWVIRKMAAGK